MSQGQVKFDLEIKGLSDLISDAEKAGSHFKTLLKETMVRSTLRVKKSIQDNLTNKKISNTGNLRRSVFTQASIDRGIIGVGELYGAAVEFGTRPHFPPVAPLERWAQTKLGKSGLGFVIARKIAREGTKAQPYAEPAFKDNIMPILRDYETAGIAILKFLGGR